MSRKLVFLINKIDLVEEEEELNEIVKDLQETGKLLFKVNLGYLC